MMFKKTLTAAFIAGIASLPMQSAQAWWGGPGGWGGPWGGGYPSYYGAPAAPAAPATSTAQ